MDHHEHEHDAGCGCHDHHEHDEHCGCQHHDHDHDHEGHCHHHDHDHAHEHEHCDHDHHEHEHHEGCGCHHHHHGHELGEQIIDGAYTFSHEGVLCGGPVTLAQAMDRVEKALLEASARIEVEGIIPGHLKALLKGGEAHAVLSVTRPGHCDRTCPKLPEEAESWALTVNLISAVRPEHDPEELVLPLFG